MADHRADRRGSRRSPSETPPLSSIATPGTQRSPGRRRATKPAPPRSWARVLPSVPVLTGVATIAVAAFGALSAVESPVTTAVAYESRHLAPDSSLSGSRSTSSSSSLLAGRDQQVSRDSSRDALADVADEKLAKEAEAQATERNAALAQLAQKAEAQAAKIAEIAEIARNAWVLPLDSYGVSAGFGASSYLWSNLHTGLDLSAPSGTPIRSVANGVVTEVGYDGSYGNKTVVTLEDGTEIWYCHQTSFLVDSGDVVRGGDTIGTVGSTGNSTGPHLHIEVRPGGGDPVDPAGAFLEHDLTL